MLFISIYATSQEVVRITQPIQSAIVKQSENTISVTVNDGISMGKCLVVFIQDPTGQWWPYTNVSKISNSTWQVEEIQFGVPRDSKKRFSIQAIIIDCTALSNGISLQNEIVFVSNGTPILMPKYDIIRKMYPKKYSAIVSVTRD